MKEKVFIVGLNIHGDDRAFDKSMEELRALAESAGAEVIARIDQNGQANPKTYIGTGKVDEIKDLAESMEVDSIIFNNELSGSQYKNLEKRIGKKIIDRTNLILDIFATRARTNEAVLQVSLAQAQYMLPRLMGLGTELSKMGGGIGTRGPGEQKLETDRRHIRNQIARIKKKLDAQVKTRETASKRRKESPVPVVSLLGYTNAGKSTIMNRVMDYTERDEDTKVYADDRLFATLQTSHRRVKYKDTDFILADTVGLIEDLPVTLIEAFKSTLEEAAFADLVLVVLDAGEDNLERQISSIKSIIEDLELGDIPKIIVYNKMDRCPDPSCLMSGGIASKSIQISALEDEGIRLLLDTIVEEVNKDRVAKALLIPYKDAGAYGKLIDKYKPSFKEARDQGYYVEVDLDIRDLSEYESFEVENGI